jgi:hypothetical protein
MSNFQNYIAVYTDIYNNIIGFKDSTGTYYPFNEFQTRAVKYYIIWLTPELSRMLNDYEIIYNTIKNTQEIRPSMQRAAGAAASRGQPLPETFISRNTHLMNLQRLLSNELRKYM